MAPSNMFSYLRPGHAKRNPSSQSSPDSGSSSASNTLPFSTQYAEYSAPPRLNDNASYTSSSPISPFPPQLPPIVRVASKLDKSSPATSTENTPSRYPPNHNTVNKSRIEQDRGMLPPPPPKELEHSLQDNDYNQSFARPRTAGAVLGLRPPTLGLPPKPDVESPSNTPSQSSAHLAPSIATSSYASFSRSQTSLISGISEKLTGSSKAMSPPTVAPVKGKSRLNLRNPMSLLMRRRSGQTVDPLSDESLVSSRSSPIVPPIPDNYDPSIRGHIVHDFNAPRINRNHSYNNAYTDNQPSQDLGRVSPQKIDREHTPVFREHFDDNTSYENSQAAIRAEQLANKDFLARNVPQFSAPEKSPPPPPPLPKDLPPPVQESFVPLQPSYPPAEDYSFVLSSSILSPVQEAPSPTDGDAPVEITPKKRKSTKTPPPARSRATSVTDPSFQPAGLPAHFSSRASRFSFQIPGGSDSAQEKLLEERHKAKAAEKASKQARMSTNTMEDEYDEYGMDDYDMDDGFDEEIPMLGEQDDFVGLGNQTLDEEIPMIGEEDEYGGLGDQSLDEEIPMLGEEEEFEGLGNQTLDTSINAFDFSSLSIQPDPRSPLSPTNPTGQLQTPIDNNGFPIGFAMSGDIPQQAPTQSFDNEPSYDETRIPQTTDPNSGNTLDEAGTASRSIPIGESAPSAQPVQSTLGQRNIDLNDDMYFDDGLIGDQDIHESTEFDENVFDDPSGPLYERRVKFAPVEDQSDSLAQRRDLPNLEIGIESGASLAHKNSIVAQNTLPNFNNMEAYHSALADAANRAEAAGRFARKASVDGVQFSSDADENSTMSTSRPSLVPDDGRFSLETNGFSPYDDGYDMSSSFVDDYDYNNFDDDLEDDPIIAAANAEALAYDDEGFYGSEFGFYASAVGETPSAWGGFFGPSGLGRTVSGRNAVREPNLTPITERSEYSTRNSFISLSHYRDGQQPLQSPALAQLARMSPYEWPEEEDMSLDSLLKLRKGAFGSSAASLPGSTSNSPRNSSPMGMQWSPRVATASGNRMKEHFEHDIDSIIANHTEEGLDDEDPNDAELMDAVNAAYEDENSEGDGEERPESPTLTSSDHNALSSPANHPLNKEAPLLPSISEFRTQSNITPSHSAQSSISTIPTLNGQQGALLGSPFKLQQRAPPPPAINTSVSSPSANVPTMTAPRRSSLGLISPVSISSPITPGGSAWRAGHSRKGSAADSVTYVREHDETGEGRWVLERRRTAESGELELIGREIVEGGRI